MCFEMFEFLKSDHDFAVLIGYFITRFGGRELSSPYFHFSSNTVTQRASDYLQS
jgi:hypothetical protein